MQLVQVVAQKFTSTTLPRRSAVRKLCPCSVEKARSGALGLHGRMAALKSSGIWRALGDGEGGFNDTLGNPYPPFAFRSGMWTVELDRGEAEELGLLAEGEAAAAADFDLAELFAGAE